MPIVEVEGLTVDVDDVGSGPGVVLVHCSASGKRQWRSLTEALAPHARVVAVNLMGYGSTTPFTEDRPQTLEDQAAVVAAACRSIDGPLSIVGHSFGGAVALATARLLGERVRRMVLLEPNPFRMLDVCGRTEAFAEANELYAAVRHLGGDGRWIELSEQFADYFSGRGTWASMTEARQQAFAASMPPNFHEWDAVMNDATTPEDWGSCGADVLVVDFGGTRRTLSEIAALFAASNRHWSFAHVPEGGHMAPLTRPDLVNPVVTEFLLRP